MDRYTPRETLPRTGLTPLEGGFGGATYRQGDRVLRFCPCPSREAQVMGLAQAHGVPVPRVLAQHSDHLELEFLEGQNLQDWLLTDVGIRPFELLGRALTRLHSIEFSQPGHFLPEFQPFPTELGEQLIEEYLKGRTGQRLGPLRDFVANLKLPPLSKVTLVHSDLNPKNLIFNHQGLYLIDWEFAMACDPLIDLGNLFRFPEDYTHDQIQAFLDNYGHPLAPDWLERARLHDLVSLLDMLNSEEDRPETHRTALNRILRLAEDLGA